jgi:uncharacterized protein involved in exopolysaccharide biosynthesis
MSDKQQNDKKKEPEIRYVPVQFIEGFAPQTSDEEVEIDLMDIIKRVWDGRKTIIKITVVFTILGILYALGSPNEYSTTTKLLPEIQQTNNLGRLGGLAAQFGFGGVTPGASNDVLPPQIYPEILSSTDFLSEIIKKKVYIDEIQDSISIEEFFNDYQNSNLFIGYTIGLPFKILRLFSTKPVSREEQVSVNESYKRLSKVELGAIIALQQSIAFNRDLQTSVLTLTLTTQNQEVTVSLVNYVSQALSDYLISYRTEKSRRSLSFLEERHEEARASFEREQERLAAFRDQNQGNLSASALTVEQNIQSEYNVKLNVYNSLTEQLEQARIKLQEDTPVIISIQESIYPNKKSGPNRLSILIIFAFLGFTFSTIYVLFKDNLSKIAESLK